MKFVILCFFLCNTLFAQKPVRDTISYRIYNTLKWDDFKADAPTDTPFSASVSTGMSYKWSYSTAAGILDFRYEIEARLYRDFSWSIYNEGKKEVLKHEQLHFDITELFARKFRKALANYEVGRSVRKDVNKIYEEVEKQRVAMQLLYDEETNHSLNKESQMSWEDKVATLLVEYELFK